MKEDKYFIPDISEMHVGCEFEMNDTWGGWKKLVLTEELLKQPMVGLGSGNERAPWYWNFRVPYLTKEQIIAEGYPHIGGKLLSTANQFYKNYTDSNNWGITYSTENKKLKIIDSEGNTLFRGICKDINTFRLICKLLKI